jgi:Flp pilus assembly protein TadG
MTRGLERGSAPVEFALVGVLFVAVALTVLQIAFVAHVRAVAIDSAIAGAAHAALADTTDSEGVIRATELVASGIAASLVRSVSVTTGETAGKAIVSVTIRLAVPAIGPLLTIAETEVTGRAFREAP